MKRAFCMFKSGAKERGAGEGNLLRVETGGGALRYDGIKKSGMEGGRPVKNIIKALAGVLLLCAILAQVSFAAAEDTVIRRQAHFQLVVGAASSSGVSAVDCYEGGAETLAAENGRRSCRACRRYDLRMKEDPLGRYTFFAGR